MQSVLNTGSVKRRRIVRSRTREMRVHVLKRITPRSQLKNGSEILLVRDRTGEKEIESRIETGNEASWTDIHL